jgi:multiple sugar transport system permease protein
MSNTLTSNESAFRRKMRAEWIKHLIVIAVLCIELLPFYMMLQISVKDNTTFIQNPWLPPNTILPDQSARPDVDTSSWRWSNYKFGIRLIAPYVANTVFVAVLSAVGTLMLSILGAYFFARYKMPFSNLFWGMFLFLLLMPSIANIVPLFNLLKKLDLLNNLFALIIVHTAAGQAFNILILKNFIEEVPKDLFEAAEIDGATHLQQVVNIVLPLCGPIIGTLAIFILIGSWNEYLLPLIIMRDKELFTLGVGLIYLDGEYVKQWGLIMSSFMVASIPLIIVFLFTMKLFIRGLSSGAVKG